MHVSNSITKHENILLMSKVLDIQNAIKAIPRINLNASNAYLFCMGTFLNLFLLFILLILMSLIFCFLMQFLMICLELFVFGEILFEAKFAIERFRHI